VCVCVFVFSMVMYPYDHKGVFGFFQKKHNNIVHRLYKQGKQKKKHAQNVVIGANSIELTEDLSLFVL